MYFPTNHFPGSMFSAVVLLLSSLLQRQLVTTQGHPGTNCYVFNAVHMDGGIRAVRALAKQHGLEFIQQVSARLNPPHVYLNWWACNLHILVQMMFFFPLLFCFVCVGAVKVLTSISYLRNIWLSSNYSGVPEYYISDQRRSAVHAEEMHMSSYIHVKTYVWEHTCTCRRTHTQNQLFFFSCEKSLYDSVGLLPVLLCFF